MSGISRVCPLLVLGLAGCKVAGFGISFGSGDLGGGGGAPDAEMTEAAFHELEGVGNSIREDRPDPSEGVQRTPVLAHDWRQQVELADRVFAPIADVSSRQKDEAARREVHKLLCEWDIQTGRLDWSKSTGEALDAGKCQSKVHPDKIYVDPGVKYAFAQVLLRGHPRRDALLDELRFHLAATIGTKPEIVDFSSNRVGDHRPHLGPAVVGLWEPTGWAQDPYRRVRAYVYANKPIADRSLPELADTVAILSTVPETSPRHTEAQDLLRRAAAMQQWKQAAKSWEPGKGHLHGKEEIAAIERAVGVLQTLASDPELGAQAQSRIADGKARINQVQADLVRAAKEAKIAAQRAEAEERHYVASLGADQRRIYKDLGAPNSKEPGTRGGEVWRYEEPVYSNLHDSFGNALLIGYRYKEYSFDGAGNLLGRRFAAQ
jgi:hypothetical protein